MCAIGMYRHGRNYLKQELQIWKVETNVNLRWLDTKFLYQVLGFGRTLNSNLQKSKIKFSVRILIFYLVIRPKYSLTHSVSILNLKQIKYLKTLWEMLCARQCLIFLKNFNLKHKVQLIENQFCLIFSN